MNTEQMYSFISNRWKSVMAGECPTFEEFESESHEDQESLYWFVQNESADLFESIYDRVCG